MKTETATHTPGPWTTEGVDGLTVHRRVDDRHYRFIALTDSKYDTGRTEPRRRSEDEANARLIAAAPELLEAAKSIDAFLEANGQRGFKPSDMLKAAIAKAEGNA